MNGDTDFGMESTNHYRKQVLRAPIERTNQILRVQTSTELLLSTNQCGNQTSDLCKKQRARQSRLLMSVW